VSKNQNIPDARCTLFGQVTIETIAHPQHVQFRFMQNQARNQGRAGGRRPLEKISPS